MTHHHAVQWLYKKIAWYIGLLHVEELLEILHVECM
jgi:hypothetical protein